MEDGVMGDGVMGDARKLGERNWRNAARNRDSWQKLLKKALGSKGGCCANDDDDDDDDKGYPSSNSKFVNATDPYFVRQISCTFQIINMKTV